LGAYQNDTQFMADFRGETLAERSFSVGDLRVEARRVTHIPDSFAFRVSAASGDGPGLVYSGDCGVSDDLVPLIREKDTVLCEAGFGAGPSDAPIHLTAQEAAGAAARGGASKLVLTHILDDRRDHEARAAAEVIFNGPVAIAQPGLKVEVQ